MKIIVLGLQQSGTSLVAGTCHAAGHRAPEPYAGTRPYTSYEWEPWHRFNIDAAGGADIWRWHPDAILPEPSSFLRDEALRVFEEAGDNATLKNPEALLHWESIWRHFLWDEAVIVYRNPMSWINRVATQHVPLQFRDPDLLSQVWLRWATVMAEVAKFGVAFRFPNDFDVLYEYLGGIGDNPVFDKTKVHRVDPAVPTEFLPVWDRLEARRVVERHG